MELKVISFNIRYCDDKDGHAISERAPRLRKVMEKYGAVGKGNRKILP